MKRKPLFVLGILAVALSFSLSLYYFGSQTMDSADLEFMIVEEEDIFDNNRSGEENFSIVVYRFPDVINSLFSEFKNFIEMKRGKKYMRVIVKEGLGECKFGVKSQLTFDVYPYKEKGNLGFWCMVRAGMSLPYNFNIWLRGPRDGGKTTKAALSVKSLNKWYKISVPLNAFEIDDIYGKNLAGDDFTYEINEILFSVDTRAPYSELLISHVMVTDGIKDIYEIF